MGGDAFVPDNVLASSERSFACGAGKRLPSAASHMYVPLLEVQDYILFSISLAFSWGQSSCFTALHTSLIVVPTRVQPLCLF